MDSGNKSILYLTQGGIIAAVYVVLTIVFAPISFGPVQVRVAEMLTILPMFTPMAIPGLFIGCLLGNMLGGAILPDIVFGSLATLIGAVLGRQLRHNRWLVPIPAIAANTIIVPLVLRYAYSIELPLPVLALEVGVGEVVSCFILGEILAEAIRRNPKLFQ